MRECLFTCMTYGVLLLKSEKKIWKSELWCIHERSISRPHFTIKVLILIQKTVLLLNNNLVFKLILGDHRKEVRIKWR